MKKSILALMAAAMLLAGAPMASAQTAGGKDKKVAVISIASYSEWMGDLGFVGKAAGRPDLATQAEGMVKLFLNDLKGMDKTKPMGAVVSMGEAPQVLAFVPVTDLKTLLDSLSRIAGQEAGDEGGGVFSMRAGPTKMFIKQKGGWAFVAQSPDQFADAPADPTTLLDGLNKEYDIAVRGYIQNIPAPMRQMAIDGLKEGASGGLGDPSDPDFAARKKLLENQIKQIELVINEADQITLGWSIDAKGERTYMDASFTVIPTGTLAKKIAAIKDTKSNFAGFLLPDAAFGMNTSSVFSDDDAAQAVASIETLKTRAMKELESEGGLDDDSKKVVKEVLGELIDVGIATIKTKHIDAGAALVLKPKALTFVAGGAVADGAAVTAALKKIVKIVEKEEGFPGIKWDADKHGGVSFHTMKVPVPDDDARKVLGAEVDVVIGQGEKSYYFGFGNDCLSKLKSTIDASKAAADDPVSPMRMSIAIAPIVQFVASIEDNPVMRMAAEEAAKLGGKDHINVVAKMIENGQTVRIEVENGVIQLIGKVADAAAGGGGPPPGAEF